VLARLGNGVPERSVTVSIHGTKTGFVIAEASALLAVFKFRNAVSTLADVSANFSFRSASGDLGL
jgi:hypothetical protein